MGEKTIGSGGQGSELFTRWISKDDCERRSTADPTRKASIFARTVEESFVNSSDPREVYGVQHDKTGNPEGDTGPPKPVQAFDYASIIERLRDEKTFEDHGRSVLVLAPEPSPRLVLTAIAAGRRTGERRVAGVSTVQVLEGEVRFTAGEERHVLSAGGTLVLQGNVSYDAEAVSDAAFLHTLVQPVEQRQGFPHPAHPTEPAEGGADLDLAGADRASE
jgi:quercetin dioxygenase-like cupin family protein